MRKLIVFLLVATVLSCGRGVKPFTFLVVTDTHIASGNDLYIWRTFLNSIKNEDADFLLLLGDFTGHAPEYIQTAKKVTDLSGVTVHFLPGNHDDNYARNPEWWKTTFDQMYYGFEHKGVQFIMNWSQDSSAAVPWLKAKLDSIPKGTPIIYAQHYRPPQNYYPDGSFWPTVETRKDDFILFLSGHSHRRMSDSVFGVPSETLDNGFMTKDFEEAYYRITVNSDASFKIEEFKLKDLDAVVPDNQPPTLSIKDKSAWFPVSEDITLLGSAEDDNAIAKLQYRIGNYPEADWKDFPGKENFNLTVTADELKPGNNLLTIRAIDNESLPSFNNVSTILYRKTDKEKADNEIVLRQGVDGYGGALDVTVRRHLPTRIGEAQDLECWVSGEGGSEEFSEFYIKFDLSGVKKPRGTSHVESVKLTLYSCRQNSLSPYPGDDMYRIGTVGSQWGEYLIFDTRPEVPGWTPDNLAYGPQALVTGEWPVVAPVQEIRPAVPVEIDLSAFAGDVERWMKKPASNFGWVISPTENDYNISFIASENPLTTMRPKLTITFK